jgi:hypothetical protein
MTDTDRAAFAEALLRLAGAFAEPMLQARIDGYFVGLADLPLETVLQAMHVVLHTWTDRRFPAPVEFRRIVPRPGLRRCELANVIGMLDYEPRGVIPITFGHPLWQFDRERYDEGYYLLELDEHGVAVAAYHRGAVS